MSRCGWCIRRFADCHERMSGVVNWILLTALVLTSSGGKLDAQCGPRSERPVEDFFRSDVVYPQERGEVQLELAPAFVTDRDGHSAGFVLATQYGLTDVWQLEASWEGPIRSGRTGEIQTWDVGNLWVGSKRSFPCITNAANHGSVSLDLQLPTASRSMDRRIRVQPSAIIGRDVAAIHAHIFTQLLVSAPLGSQPAPAVFGAGATAIVGTLAQCNVGMFVQSHALRATGEFTVSGGSALTTDLTMTPGVIWHSSPFEVGVGAMIPLNQGAGRGALMHVVYEFGGGER